MQKRRPLDHSNYSIYITQCHSGTWRTHQTLLLTRALPLMRPTGGIVPPIYSWPCLPANNSSALQTGCPFQSHLFRAQPLTPRVMTSAALICDHFYWRTFNSCFLCLTLPPFFLAKLIGSNRHLPKDYKVSQSFHKEASDLAIKSPTATIYANNNE